MIISVYYNENPLFLLSSRWRSSLSWDTNYDVVRIQRIFFKYSHCVGSFSGFREKKKKFASQNAIIFRFMNNSSQTHGIPYEFIVTLSKYPGKSLRVWSRKYWCITCILLQLSINLSMKCEKDFHEFFDFLWWLVCFCKPTRIYRYVLDFIIWSNFNNLYHLRIYHNGAQSELFIPLSKYIVCINRISFDLNLTHTQTIIKNKH